MASSVRGFSVRDVTQHGRPQLSNLCVNPGKVLPASATGNLFAITGVIVVTGIHAIVTTVLTATNVKPTIGVTGSPAAIASAPVAALTATAVGSVLTPASVLGGPLPVPLSAQGSAPTAGYFVCSAANITLTTDATNTGALTWLLEWSPLYPKAGAAVTAV